MSRERAQRRAARQAEAAQRREAAARRNARAARWRGVRARFARRRVGRLTTRRNRAQFAGIGVGLCVVLTLTWYVADAWPVRIAVLVLALLALPALITLTLDRSTR